jgi:hypothetical protein
MIIDSFIYSKFYKLHDDYVVRARAWFLSLSLSLSLSLFLSFSHTDSSNYAVSTMARSFHFTLTNITREQKFVHSLHCIIYTYTDCDGANFHSFNVLN